MECMFDSWEGLLEHPRKVRTVTALNLGSLEIKQTGRDVNSGGRALAHFETASLECGDLSRFGGCDLSQLVIAPKDCSSKR